VKWEKAARDPFFVYGVNLNGENKTGLTRRN
jgi:hypothetical protein